ncbi:MAG TPA: aminotransferase class V-fold PLP-dependent enzyme [Thermoanaerobaculia bacterium]|jgi:aromatic-L-amino-acid decarboxylase|nr:aminotransferase class V-fold PLP-dependent enzyme [Thermoanaerobaculia bacterium]
MNYPLEPNAEEMHRLVHEAMRRIVAHIESLPTQPATNVEGATEYARTLIEPLPQRGESYESLLDFLFHDAIPRSFTAAGPGYLAYVPGGGLFHSAVADLIADAVNRYVGVCAAAPALVQLESNVIRWFCEIVGLPRGSGGVLTPGGSLANFIALVTARKAMLPDDFLRGTMYCSNQIHHSFQKAANLAGFPYANIRELPVDEKFRIRVDALQDAIARDRAEGWTPFLIAGSAGTTPTGAVDDLEALARVAREEKLWFHVDGAYGALFILTERGRAALRGIEQADSLILDPHKTLFLPFGTGAVLVRDAGALRRAHSSHADYLPDMQQEDELVDFCEISPELSRDFRGLRVWLPLKLFGIAPFREQLDEKLDLIQFALEELRSIDGIEIIAEPQLTILAFRLVRPGLSPAELDTLNRALLDRIVARKRVLLTPAILDGVFVIRIAIVSHRTHRDRVEMALADIRAAVGEV